MVTEALLSLLFNIVSSALDSTPIGNVAWSVGSETLAPFFEIVRSVCYFLPVGTVSSIIGVIVVFNLIRFAIRLIVTIWDLLPFV